MGGSHDLTPGRWVAVRGEEVVVSGASATEVVEWLRGHGERAETMYRLPTEDDPFFSGAVTPSGEAARSRPRRGSSATAEQLRREAQRVASDPADREEMRRIREHMDSIAADWPSEPA